MKSPPFSIHPGLTPVSPSIDLKTSLDLSMSCMSTSEGRRRHRRPAVCQVVPEVSLSLSRRTALVTPSLVRWYRVWQPRLPPPAWGKNELDF